MLWVLVSELVAGVVAGAVVVLLVLDCWLLMSVEVEAAEPGLLLTAELPGLAVCEFGVPAVSPAPVPVACDWPAVPASGLGVVVLGGLLLTAELPGLDCCDVGVPAVLPAPVPLACACPAVPASGLGVVVPLAALLCVVSVAVLGVAV